MAPNFSGKWKLSRNENFVDYLKAMHMGVPADKIHEMKGFVPVETIDQNGDNFSVTITTPKGDRSKQFVVGQEYEDEVENGMTLKVRAEWKGDSLVASFTPSDTSKPKGTITRTLEGANMVLTIDAAGVQCKRFFDKC
eukprot:GHVO01050206.1.p1 GENE.GHVO01050206.1~~GHVO01050206.1.p1  ORF type:complete len:138 (+),score=21.99 GHVO01050206.1:59-472(+)